MRQHLKETSEQRILSLQSRGWAGDTLSYECMSVNFLLAWIDIALNFPLTAQHAFCIAGNFVGAKFSLIVLLFFKQTHQAPMISRETNKRIKKRVPKAIPTIFPVVRVGAGVGDTKGTVDTILNPRAWYKSMLSCKKERG